MCYIKSMKKKIAIAILIIIAFIAVISVYIFLNWPVKSLSTAEKEVALTNILGRKPNLNEKQSAKGNLEFKGNTVSFLHPAAGSIFVHRVDGKIQKDNWNLDSFSFDLDDPRTKILVTVSQAPSDVTSINDYSGVRLRQLQFEVYLQKDVLVDSHSGFVFSRQDNSGFEKTAFFYFKNRIYIFSIIGNDLKSVEDVYKTVIQSAKFL